METHELYIRDLARVIGHLIETDYPAVKLPEMDNPTAVPMEHAEAITEAITLVVAEILQAWLDAGSERDVTMEDLYEPVLNHVKGWAYPDASDGA